MNIHQKKTLEIITKEIGLKITGVTYNYQSTIIEGTYEQVKAGVDRLSKEFFIVSGYETSGYDRTKEDGYGNPIVMYSFLVSN